MDAIEMEVMKKKYIAQRTRIMWIALCTLKLKIRFYIIRILAFVNLQVRYLEEADVLLIQTWPMTG